jgi:hypothetical protein
MLSQMPGAGMYAEEETVGVDHILSNIRLAIGDDRILGIYLCGGQLSVG